MNDTLTHEIPQTDMLLDVVIEDGVLVVYLTDAAISDAPIARTEFVFAEGLLQANAYSEIATEKDLPPQIAILYNQEAAMSAWDEEEDDIDWGAAHDRMDALDREFEARFGEQGDGTLQLIKDKPQPLPFQPDPLMNFLLTPGAFPERATAASP